ncbi:MAG: NUDIX domain-containing protein [Flavobacteriaceae bacterium]|nr:NUDIX domain-containing protein [Bacteroidia bacterium]NNK87942.1 NUDIX domain-containing protein [Flavobacteriaceae bacterium]
MDEYIDLVNPEGKPLGKRVLKSDAHLNGWYHNTIHVWLYDKTGHVLLAQRSAAKLIFPLLWDVSAAGHVDAGEQIIHAAIREVDEELGLKLDKDVLNFVGVFKHEKEYDNGRIRDYEFHHAYIAPLKVGIGELRLQPGEVDGVKLVGPGEFMKLLEESPGNSHFVPTNASYYKLILDEISNAVKN